MLQPELVREIVYSMQRKVSIPVTVKCRIGADDLDTYEDLLKFIRCASKGGAKKFIIHSRKCLLNGLTTKQNREIPPLQYEVVHRLINEFPELRFVLNGGIQSFSQAKIHINREGYLHNVDNLYYESLPPVHGVMIGRAAYSNPLMFCTADSEFFGVRDPCLSRRDILSRYIDYCEWAQSDEGPRRIVKNKNQMVSTSVLLNSMRNIIHGIKNVNKFRLLLNDLYIGKRLFIAIYTFFVNI